MQHIIEVISMKADNFTESTKKNIDAFSEKLIALDEFTTKINN